MCCSLGFYFFLLSLLMLEIQSKSLQWEISLHWFQIQAVYCCHQSSMSPAFFMIKLLAKYFVCLLSLGA